MIFELLKEIVPGGLSAAVLVFLLRNWIGERIRRSIQLESDAKLENIKSQLKRDNDVYLAELSAKHTEAIQAIDHNLQIARLEHQVRISGVYREVLNSIKEIHSIIINIQRALNDYTRILEYPDDEPQASRRQRISELVSDFWEMFNPSRIFLTDKLDNDIVDYIKFVSDKMMEFAEEVEGKEGGCRRADYWYRINVESQGLWDTALDSIRVQFRGILGIEMSMPKSKSENAEDMN